MGRAGFIQSAVKSQGRLPVRADSFAKVVQTSTSRELASVLLTPTVLSAYLGFRVLTLSGMDDRSLRVRKSTRSYERGRPRSALMHS